MSTLGAAISKLLTKQKFRFLIVGGFNTFFGYAAFAITHVSFGAFVGYLGALLIAHAISSTMAFALYKRFVFLEGQHGLTTYLKFQSVYVTPLVANLVALPLLVEILNCPVLLAQAGFSIAWVGLSFVIHKRYTFRVVSRKKSG